MSIHRSVRDNPFAVSEIRRSDGDGLQIASGWRMGGMMLDSVAPSLFLLAFWAPPLAVVAGALALFLKAPETKTSPFPAHAAVVHR